MTMATYVGETVEITNEGLDFDGQTELTPTQIASCTVEIVDSTLTVIVSTTAMTWNPAQSHWFYMWNTTGLTPGSFRAKVVMTGTSGTVSFAYLTIRLSAPVF